MNSLKKIFGSFSMTWRRVLLLALLCALCTAGLKIIPALNDTSLQDIAVYPECWLMLAVFIVVNCEKRLEAACKCFVFFLVSQPLIYLFQVPFNPLGWDIFMYYPRWFLATLLTFPAALAAFELKKPSVFSFLMLLAAELYLGLQTAEYVCMCVERLPHHLLSILFCLAAAVCLALRFAGGKKRCLACLLSMAAAALVLIAVRAPGQYGSAVLELSPGSWQYALEDEELVELQLQEDGSYLIVGKKNGSTLLEFTDPQGQTMCYSIVSSGKSLSVSLVD